MNPKSKRAENQSAMTSESTDYNQALISQFWRQMGRLAGPPVVASALLLTGCGDTATCAKTGADAVTASDTNELKDTVATKDTDNSKDTQEKIKPDAPIAIDGRPFMVSGELRKSTLVEGTNWGHDTTIPVSQLTHAQRVLLATHWSTVAQGEHASIASFGRFTLELLSLGAPQHLLTQTAQALSDEVEHAKLAISMARHYGGQPVDFGPLDVEHSLQSCADPAAILHDTIVGGCINETLAVAQLKAAASLAQVPAIKTALQTLANDESRHAALAWETARWILERWPELQATAKAAFDQHALPKPKTDVPQDAVLEAHGYLTPIQQHAALKHAMQTVIEPCKRTLLG